ncbi:CynX/NimT family MFS transporter [Microbacterium sp. SORGH_AS_0888]|uniref:MFS transporter n=1 Tax=Microbacterium sp. SORGH_AS_0888 TaxID=3041791 RepID=UPI00277F94A9|nr:MFS transporter [Microbacterium sp. SORGH_AS_0888]MDQ1129621.1 CP family cyanate transporter-like MFS transporter [Microbacterium sp. SORGH_AS_0888]
MSPTPRRSGVLLLVIAIATIAMMLRAPIVAVAPVARTIGTDLGVSAAVVGLFTSIPVLAFAVCSPLAIAVVRRGGPDLALTLSMIGAVAGCVVRSLDGLPTALIGTALIGVFLTIGNVVVPVVIARDFPPSRVHLMTGVYTSAINVGTMTVTVATAPLAAATDWRTAIAVWGMFGVAALAAWVGLRGFRGAFLPAPRSESADAAAGRPSVLRAGTTWVLGAAFAGQAFSYYAVTAWLPTLLTDRGFGSEASGAIAAFFQVAGIAGGLLVPVLTTRVSIMSGALAVGLGWLTVPIGFLVAPELWWLWCLIGGAAQGGGLTVVFIMVAALGGGPREITGRSGIVQGIGYGLAALGPTIVGGVHEWTGDWTLPLLVILLAVLLFGVLGVGVAARLRRA